MDLTEKIEDTEWYSHNSRFAVSSIGELDIGNELVEVVLPKKE